MLDISNIDNNSILQSLISEKNFNLGKKIIPIIYNSNQIKKYTDHNFVHYISTSFDFSNKLYGIESKIDTKLIEKILLLHNTSVKFELKDTLETQFEIKSNDFLFPICCVGKNRSQFLFYYLKKLQQEFPSFHVGYPASGDEISSIISSNKNNILGGFTVQYKSDCFSKSIEYSFGKEVSRSIHVFDKLIRNPESYSNSDIENLEPDKYRFSSYDIFDKDSVEIKKLYMEYYLNPSNIRKLVSNFNLCVTWICLSPESFNNLVSVLYELKNTNKQLDLSNTRIIYYGFNDIFQSSKINVQLLEKLYLNIAYTFVYSK